MKRSRTLFFSLFFVILLLNGCNQKKGKENPFEKKTETRNSTTQDKAASTEIATFTLEDNRNKKITLSVDANNHIHLDDNMSKPVIILNFFTPWSYPSRSQLACLVDLQKKHEQTLRVIGVMLNPHDHTEQIEEVLRKTGADLLFVATGKENNTLIRRLLKPLHLLDLMPIPLTIIYHNGIYFRHYKSAVPFEMIEHDFKTITE